MNATRHQIAREWKRKSLASYFISNRRLNQEILSTGSLTFCVIIASLLYQDDTTTIRDKYNHALYSQELPSCLYGKDGSFGSSQACLRQNVVQCESPSQAETTSSPNSSYDTKLKPLSYQTKVLHQLKILRNLPTPRILTPTDPLFSYPELKRGIKQRRADEAKIRALQPQAIQARNSGDQEEIKRIFGLLSVIAYGGGNTPQMRADFLAKYGCTGYTPEILKYITELCIQRGIVEIGAGNGQWARAIRDYHQSFIKEQQEEIQQRQQSTDPSVLQNKQLEQFYTYKRLKDFILPYDDMSELPLSPTVYHSLTQPAHDYFHPNVEASSHIDAVRKMTSRGRVLLLVYPPPGPMALEAVKNYVDIYPQGNDTLIYVGEGVGGANANPEFFQYLLNNDDGEYEWCVMKVMDVLSSGGKGYEKMFVLQRRRVQ